MVVGCGRSGTLFMSKVLQILGFDVGHEILGKDGMSSWMHSFGVRQKRVLQNELKEFPKFYIHVTRNPLEVIQSMTVLTHMKRRNALNYFRAICPDETYKYKDYELGVFYWIFWNQMIEKRGAGVDIRVKLEDLSTEKGIKDLCKALKVRFSKLKMSKIKALGKEQHKVPVRHTTQLISQIPALKETLTLEYLNSLNPNLCDQLIAQAKVYGYDLRK